MNSFPRDHAARYRGRPPSPAGLRRTSSEPARPGTWYLSDIGRAQGLQELFTRQSPQKLKVLREHAIAQSAVSSNRIEGIEIDQARVGTVVFGHPALKDRDEEEVAGYRDALNLIHTQGADLPVSEETILNRKVLGRLKGDQVECLGRGQSAQWRRLN